MHQQWHTRYSYDKVSNICRPFNYSGCEGNSNNFDSLYACQHTCVALLSSSYSSSHNSPARRQPNDLIEKCQMPRDHGKCHLGNLHPLAFTKNEGDQRLGWISGKFWEIFLCTVRKKFRIFADFLEFSFGLESNIEKENIEV